MIAADSDYFLLELKPSIIPNAGLGVFAKADLPQGIIICKYRGAIFLSKLKNKILTMNDRGLILNKDSFIAGSNCVASFINDIIDLEESKKLKKLVPHHNKEYNCFYQRSFVNS
jgi:hypothetical protein